MKHTMLCICIMVACYILPVAPLRLRCDRRVLVPSVAGDIEVSPVFVFVSAFVFAFVFASAFTAEFADKDVAAVGVALKGA